MDGRLDRRTEPQKDPHYHFRSTSKPFFENFDVGWADGQIDGR